MAGASRRFGAGRRFRASGIHLAASVLIASVAAAVIFMIWYPSPYQVIAGGVDLFVLVMSVDVIAGPALTFVAVSPGKPRVELRRDLLVIALIQVGALGYGMYTVAQARPVVLAFEVDRLRVVSAAEIDPATLTDAPPGLRDLSWSGPRRIAAVKPRDPSEVFRSMQLGMAGIDLSMDPRNWRFYESQGEAAWSVARPIQHILDRYPTTRAEAARIARDAGRPLTALRYLPLQSRRVVWTAVVVEPDARIVGFLPVDGFL